MLSNELIDIYNYITKEAGKMVSEFVDRKDLTGKSDFASVYSKSEREFETFTQELKDNGTPADIQKTGTYYWLNRPLETSLGTIRRCRIRIADGNYKERGYVDFEVKNYQDFKKKYLKDTKFKQIDNPKVEMIELKSPGFNVRAYFPDTEF